MLNNIPLIRAQKTQCCPMREAGELQTPYLPTLQARETHLAAGCCAGHSALDELFNTRWARHTLSGARDAPWDAAHVGGSTWVPFRACQGPKYWGWWRKDEVNKSIFSRVPRTLGYHCSVTKAWASWSRNCAFTLSDMRFLWNTTDQTPLVESTQLIILAKVNERCWEYSAEAKDVPLNGIKRLNQIPSIWLGKKKIHTLHSWRCGSFFALCP